MVQLLNVMDFSDLLRSVEGNSQLVEHIPAQQHASSGRKGHFYLHEFPLSNDQINQKGGPNGDVTVVATNGHCVVRGRIPLIYKRGRDDGHPCTRIELGPLGEKPYGLEGRPNLQVQIRC